ncbi:cobalt-precorrin 5A hydrolase [uncultured Megasphaera sp.]|uniref:cobalt-precorrin 5A hydrolase n=1 Tax=uncultured Megasphaera sp. TaxID=165188 RepID=UPI00259839EB|nr:cobalamin biosynthesis protein [uncultured Megasphaera sp.]
MKAVVFSFTQTGTALGCRVAAHLRGEGWDVRQASLKKFAVVQEGVLPFTPNLHDEAARAFEAARLVVFIGAAGIAVRTIAPFIRHKDLDPAVLVIDEKGQFVIPLLSGHIGGANAIARRLAEELQGQAVVTTATDVNALFAVDEWAARQGLRLSSLADAKAFAAAMLEKGAAGVYSDFPLQGPLPQGLVYAFHGDAGLVITTKAQVPVFRTTVVARPVIVHVGIGCRKGTTARDIAYWVNAVLQRANLSPDAIADVSSIDVKRGEAGLLAFAKAQQWPLHFFTADELNAVPGDFTASDFVKERVGTDNVCERAAVLASHQGTLIVTKQSRRGITVAVACERYQARFDY